MGDQTLAEIGFDLVWVSQGIAKGLISGRDMGMECTGLEQPANLMVSEDRKFQSLSSMPAGVNNAAVPMTFWRDQM